MDVYCVVSWFVVNVFGFKDWGVIVLGKCVDIVFLSDFEDCCVDMVLCCGVVVGDEVFLGWIIVVFVGFDSVKVDLVDFGCF